MSSSKTTTFFIVALLLLFTLSSASRPLPASREATATLVKTQHEVIEKEEISCKGVGEEECLMRRTLAAHLDYIYTQKENKP